MVIVASKILKIPIVLTIGTRMEHSQSLYNSLFLFVDMTFVKHLVARRADRVISLDILMREYIIERYGIDER